MIERSGEAILAIAGDAGGASAVAPVVARLRASGRPVTALAYRQARSVWAGQGIAYIELSEAKDQTTVSGWLHSAKPTLVLTGTSVNGVDLEKQFIAAATRSNVPSVAVLDFWSNYRPRFADQRGDLTYLPDRVAVMDTQARSEMIAEGFPPERLVVTGQPAFDCLAAVRVRSTPAARAELRNALGVRERQRMVLFASQPLAALWGNDPSVESHPGYTEQTVLDLLCAALSRIVLRRGGAITLVVRPHPREGVIDLSRFESAPVRVISDSTHDGRQMALAADLVVGMTTVLLVEACLLGCVTVSLQPGLRKADVLPTNRAGLTRAVYDARDVEGNMEALLFDHTARGELLAKERLESPAQPQATRQVVELIDSLVGCLVAAEAGRGS